MHLAPLTREAGGCVGQTHAWMSFWSAMPSCTVLYAEGRRLVLTFYVLLDQGACDDAPTVLQCVVHTIRRIRHRTSVSLLLAFTDLPPPLRR